MYNSAVEWLSEHWFDLLQTTGIVGSLLLATYTTRRDERARRVGNSIVINGQYQELQKELIRHPQLKHVFAENADVERESVSIEEEAYVKMVIGQLSTVYRAMRHGEFVTLEGLQKDVREFFALPVPKAVWDKFKPFQDQKFVEFVENSWALKPSIRQ